MAHKHVLFRSAARDKILRGATQLADAVRVTLGPRSKSVLIERKWGAPIVCNDGVTIAKEFDLKDADENLGARMLRQAAEKTGELVGDGTSTATVLAHAIYADGLRNVVAGASAIDLKRGLNRGAKAAIEALRTMSRPVATRKEKAQVAGPLLDSAGHVVGVNTIGYAIKDSQAALGFAIPIDLVQRVVPELIGNN
jgi:chaperonin GroEL